MTRTSEASHAVLMFVARGVAQLGSAGALGALGRRFESCRPDWDLRKTRKAWG